MCFIRYASRCCGHMTFALCALLLAAGQAASEQAEVPAGPDPDPASAEGDRAVSDAPPTIPVDEAAPEPAAAPRPAELENIVVTATKREKSVREVPISIDALRGEDLVRQGATQLEDIVRLSPGLTKNGSRVVIRAVATTAVASFVTSEETGRFLGDTSLNAPSIRGGLVDFDPYDMSTVEVLKGPQATLFGGTALAGAVRYVPNPPDPHAFSGSVRAGWGSLAHTGDPQGEVSFMLNGGFFDSVGLRVVGTRRERPGVVDDLRTGERDIDVREITQARVLGTWRPWDFFSVDVTYLDWQDQGEWTFTSEPDRYVTGLKTMKEPIELNSEVLSVRGEYRFRPLSVVAAATFLDNSLDWVLDLSPLLGTSGAPNQNTADIIDTRAETPSYELRVVSNGPTESAWTLLRDWEYLVGVFVMRSKQHANQLVVVDLLTPVPGITTGGSADGRALSDADEDAVFFDATRTLLDQRIEINLGGRYARTHLDMLSFTESDGEQVTPATNQLDDARFNPKLALTWHVLDDLSVRGSAAQGFRFGGANANATAAAEDIPRTFDSDSLWNYEVGLRSDWLGRTLRFDVTGFRIDWTDLQITQVTDSGSNFVTNVGGARIVGAESSLLWWPADVPFLPEGLSLSVGGSYIDARITEAFDSENGRVEKGTRLPLAPYLLGNAALGWDGALGPWLLNASVSHVYSGPRKNELRETAALPAFTSLGAVLRISNPGWKFAPALSVTGTNLLDEAVPHFAFPATTNNSEVSWVVNRPRTVVLNLEASFF